MTKKMYGVKGKRMEIRQCPGGKHLALKIWLLLPPNSSGTCLSTKGVESILHGEGGMHSTVPHEHVMLVSSGEREEHEQASRESRCRPRGCTLLQIRVRHFQSPQPAKQYFCLITFRYVSHWSNKWRGERSSSEEGKDCML